MAGGGGQSAGRTAGQAARRNSGQVAGRTGRSVTDFGPRATGQPGGKTLDSEYWLKLGKYLDKRGVKLMPTGTGGKNAFTPATATQKAVLRLSDDATRYTAWHELAHFRHYQKIGAEAYSKLPRVPGNHVPEQTVYNTLRQPTRWARLTAEQQVDAVRYIVKVGGQP